jgi:hypothetical protein
MQTRSSVRSNITRFQEDQPSLNMNHVASQTDCGSGIGSPSRGKRLYLISSMSTLSSDTQTGDPLAGTAPSSSPFIPHPRCARLPLPVQSAANYAKCCTIGTFDDRSSIVTTRRILLPGNRLRCFGISVSTRSIQPRGMSSSQPKIPP